MNGTWHRGQREPWQTSEEWKEDITQLQKVGPRMDTGRICQVPISLSPNWTLSPASDLDTEVGLGHSHFPGRALFIGSTGVWIQVFFLPSRYSITWVTPSLGEGGLLSFSSKVNGAKVFYGMVAVLSWRLRCLPQPCMELWNGLYTHFFFLACSCKPLISKSFSITFGEVSDYGSPTLCSVL
jgi:hypothetical protein